MPFIPVTEKEIKTIDSITNSLHKILGNDYYELDFTTKLRFLRGNKHEIKDVIPDLIRYMKWRKDNDVDNIIQKIPEFQPAMDTGVCRYGYWDLHQRPAIFISVQKHSKTNRVIRHFELLLIHMLEKLTKLAKQDEQRIIVAFDLANFTLANMDYEVLKPLLNILQKNYPETLEKIFVIDSPFIFRACWAIIKPWLDPVTASKVDFIKRSKLEEHFSPENIPDFSQDWVEPVDMKSPFNDEVKSPENSEESEESKSPETSEESEESKSPESIEETKQINEEIIEKINEEVIEKELETEKESD